MALVVTARSPAAILATPRVALRALAVAASLVCAFALVLDSAARTLPAIAWLDSVDAVVTVVAAVLVAAVCAAAWLTRRFDSGLLLAATLAPLLYAVRAIAAAVLNTLDLLTLGEVTADGLGLLVLGSSAWAASTWMIGPPGARRVDAPQADLFKRVAEVTAFVLFAVGLSGAAVQAVGAGWACSGVFPDCNGLGILPFGRDPLADVQLYHRLLAYVGFGLVLWLTVEAFRTQRHLRRASLALLGVTSVDAVIGVATVSLQVPPLAEVAHAAATTATCAAAVGLVVVAHRRQALAAAAPTHVARLLSAYVQLTKPRVMSLLLATTVTAMVIAARGMPNLGTLIATVLGGALMSGGAGAINHYVDRDIDPLMGRTAWRPIPSGIIAPRDALRFGIALAVIASVVFLVFVNPLAMVLSQVGLLGYVFIYTLWLKRSTPSNIVIGGAAGAIPPLVGWAAVTNEVGSLTAWYLFAIIFFWTPPHFWALSLLIRQHYERAGVPMLPVVRGDTETRRQIILYSLLLVVLTLVLSPFGMMGLYYFAAALVLGGLFIHNAVRLWREATREAARRLYLYSILYLFALFTAMAVDRVLVN
ncbi:MAG: protoheme IX farnesyltransferase [Chloroflexi bacterium]|nr:protoheme IX farnesyltransferase [Chloroflexota bacterium]